MPTHSNTITVKCIVKSNQHQSFVNHVWILIGLEPFAHHGQLRFPDSIAATPWVAVMGEIWMRKFAVPVWVEFEIKEGQPDTAAQKAILRGVEAMKSVMEQGSGSGQTGVKPGSVRAEIADQARVWSRYFAPRTIMLSRELDVTFV
jgi:hypothetical protein